MKIYLDRDEKFVIDFAEDPTRYYDGGVEVEVDDDLYINLLRAQDHFYRSQRELEKLYRDARQRIINGDD